MFHESLGANRSLVLALNNGSKGNEKGEEKEGGEEREREGKKEIKSVTREQFQVHLSGPN